jgi:uncharacterized membrane protein YsdA (DUF1294 family)
VVAIASLIFLGYQLAESFELSLGGMPPAAIYYLDFTIWCLMAVVGVVVAALLIRATGAFTAVIQTADNDVEHLMRGLARLRDLLQLIFVAAMVGAGRLPFAVLGLYLFASLATFLAYARDKRAAQTGRWRASESSLHGLALLGGWPGALVAQELLRHKSKKQSFRLVFWATVLLNCLGLLVLFTPAGSEALRALLGRLHDWVNHNMQ